MVGHAVSEATGAKPKKPAENDVSGRRVGCWDPATSA
jgi:hypothetical protein